MAVRALSLQLKRKQRKSFASSNVESNKLKQQPKLRVTHKLRSGEVLTGACGGCIIAAQATVKGSRGGGGTISLKTVTRAAPNLQIAVPLFVQARYIMMTIPSSQVVSPNATPPVRLNSSTTQMKRGMAMMISWVKLHVAVSKAANLKKSCKPKTRSCRPRRRRSSCNDSSGSSDYESESRSCKRRSPKCKPRRR